MSSTSSLKRSAPGSPDEPSPKRPKTLIHTLSVGDPLRLLTTHYLTDLRRLEGHEGIPSDLLDIVFGYAAPTALERLANDCPASLLETVEGADKKKISNDLYDAAWEIFHMYATGINKEYTPFPHKTMTREDCCRFYVSGIAPNKRLDTPEATQKMHTNADDFIQKYGISHWFQRSEVSFDGFCEFFRNWESTNPNTLRTRIVRSAKLQQA